MKLGVVFEAELKAVSPPTRGARIETVSFGLVLAEAQPSPPTRGARIETRSTRRQPTFLRVAPHAGGAD